MKVTDAFHLPEPPPWQEPGTALDLLVAPVIPGRHPCGNCPAPCCWYVPIEQGTLESTDDLDAITQYLAYEGLVVWVEAGGSYNVGIVTPCRLLERATCACTVHDQPEQPRFCVEFDARTCWYRARFEAGRAEEALRLDGHTWPDYRARVRLSDDGLVGGLPQLSPYDLLRTERGYEQAASIDLDIPEESAISADRRGDMLVFLSSFEGVRVVRAGGTWQMRFVTRRDVDAGPTGLESPPGGGAGGASGDLTLDATALRHLNERLGAGLWDASVLDLRVALDTADRP